MLDIKIKQEAKLQPSFVYSSYLVYSLCSAETITRNLTLDSLDPLGIEYYVKLTRNLITITQMCKRAVEKVIPGAFNLIAVDSAFTDQYHQSCNNFSSSFLSSIQQNCPISTTKPHLDRSSQDLENLSANIQT